jgi:hypothetical protein
MDKSPEHNKKIHAFLDDVLAKDYPKIVLHEAIEALGNISQESALKMFDSFSSDKDDIVYETCYLTKRLYEW